MAAGALLAIGAPAGAAIASAAFGVDVILIAPHSPDVVSLNRALWKKGEPVAELYGIPAGRPTRVLFTGAARLLVPPEDPTMTLLPADGPRLESRTVWFAVRIAAPLGVLLGAAGALIRGGSKPLA